MIKISIKQTSKSKNMLHHVGYYLFSVVQQKAGRTHVVL